MKNIYIAPIMSVKKFSAEKILTASVAGDLITDAENAAKEGNITINGSAISDAAKVLKICF